MSRQYFILYIDTSSKHIKNRVNTTSMKRREMTSLNDVSYHSDVKVLNKVVVANRLFFTNKFKIRVGRIPRG